MFPIKNWHNPKEPVNNANQDRRYKSFLMDIDLQYLLFLQQLRMLLGGHLDEIFNGISKFAVDFLPFLPYVIFWSVHRKWGYRLISIYITSCVVNGLIKLTVCAYRPWIRSDLVEPAGDSKVAATGYSFPSGHSTEAAAVYGTTAVWQRNTRRSLSVFCVIMVFLTGFSRNFLGVHTPQDVFVGIISSSLVIFLVLWIEQKIGNNAKAYDWLTLAGILVVIISIIYITTKSYPMDYVDGKLLVDPLVMMTDTFKSLGCFTGFLIASWLERHKWHYEIPVGSTKLPLMTGLGVLILMAWRNIFSAAIFVHFFGRNAGNFIGWMVFSLIGILFWPMLITKVCREDKTKND